MGAETVVRVLVPVVIEVVRAVLARRGVTVDQGLVDELEARLGVEAGAALKRANVAPWSQVVDGLLEEADRG